MNTRITTETILRVPICLPAELEYNLGPADFVAWWEFLACKARRYLPERIRDGLIRVLAFVHAGVGIAVGMLAFASLGNRFPDSKGIAGVALLFAAVSCFALGLILAREYPALYFRGFLSKPCRWVCLLYLRHLARMEAKRGRTNLLDVVSRYRFAISLEGFAYTTEYQQQIGGSTVTLWKRRDEISWKAVEVAGSTKQHIFFAINDAIPIIVPRFCFADDDSFRVFASQMAKYYHQARQKKTSPSCRSANGEPRIDAPHSNAVMPGLDDRFGPR